MNKAHHHLTNFALFDALPLWRISESWWLIVRKIAYRPYAYRNTEYNQSYIPNLLA